jgi:hypothetical protein
LPLLRQAPERYKPFKQPCRMKQKFNLILIFYSTFVIYGQNEVALKNDISFELYSKCFPNLNQGSEIFEKYPEMQKFEFCSIFKCVALLAYQEEFIQEIGKARLRGIATQLYREGNPVILISGMDSSAIEIEENKNTKDNDNIVYVSVGECVIPNYVWTAKEVFNKQTRMLIEKNKNGL